MGQMRRDAHISVMPPSSDVIEMETVLTFPKYVTRIWIAGMEVMSSTALTPVIFVGLKGNIFMLSAFYQAHEAQPKMLNYRIDGSLSVYIILRASSARELDQNKGLSSIL